MQVFLFNGIFSTLSAEAITNYNNLYRKADSSSVLEVIHWSLTNLYVKEVGAGWRVAISTTLQCHIISF